MQLVIPMSGLGQRFKFAGYETPKPLIEIEGKTIIEHILGMFPGINDVIFICNKDHKHVVMGLQRQEEKHYFLTI